MSEDIIEKAARLIDEATGLSGDAWPAVSDVASSLVIAMVLADAGLLVGESDPCGGVHVGTKESYPACVVCGDTGESDPGELRVSDPDRWPGDPLRDSVARPAQTEGYWAAIGVGSEEPCVCHTNFVCMARHIDDPYEPTEDFS